MKKFTDIVTDTHGEAVNLATVTVVNYPSSSATTIFSDDVGTVVSGSVVTTDSTGTFNFYAAPGRYNLQVRVAGALLKTITDVQIDEGTDEEVGTFAALLGTVGRADGQIVTMASYYAGEVPDGGGGQFKWSSTSTATHNAGTVIKPTAVSGAGRWLRTEAQTISANQFGVSTSRTATQNAVSLAAALAAMTSGRRFTALPGTYDLDLSNGSTLATFTSFSDLTFDLPAVVWNVTTVYTASQGADFIKFYKCDNVKIEGMRGVSPIFGTLATRNVTGVAWFQFLEGGSSISWEDVRLTGGKRGFWFETDYSDVTETPVRNITFSGYETTGIYYALNFAYSGNNVRGSYKTSQVGRSFVAYGVSDIKVSIESERNHADDVAISAINGQATKNITVDYYNKNTAAADLSGAGVAMAFIEAHYDAVGGASTLSDINLTLRADVLNGGLGLGFQMYKTNDATGTHDTADRGHVFRNVNVSLRVINANASFIPFKIAGDGTWGTGDFIEGLRLEKSRVTGSSAAAVVNLASVSGRATIDDVWVPNDLQLTGGTGGGIIVRGSIATNFTAATSENNLMGFYDSNITSGSTQSVKKKVFVNTAIGANRLGGDVFAFATFPTTGGAGAVTPESSYNVSAITKNGTGDYYVDTIAAANDVLNLCPIASQQASKLMTETLIVSASRVQVRFWDAAGVATDPASRAYVAIFRGF